MNEYKWNENKCNKKNYNMKNHVIIGGFKSITCRKQMYKLYIE